MKIISKMTKQEVSVNITKANEDEYVSVIDCNDCPEDSACIPQLKNSRNEHICVCYHFGKDPLLKGDTCKRKTVTGPPSIIDHHQHIPVQVHPGSKPLLEATPSGGLESTNYILSSSILITLLVTSVFLLLFVAVCLFKRKSLCRYFRSNQSKSKYEMKNSNGNRLLLPNDRFINNPTYESTCIDLAIRVFTPEDIKLMAQIGQGCFGKVFKGDLNGDEVAVKVVKKEYSDEAIKEVETMATFCHPNILHLIGVVRDAESEAPWLIFEFMKHGDLANVLRSCNKKFPASPMFSACSSTSENVTNVGEDDHDELTLNTDVLLDFASQIAEGMSYLSSQHFVHRDLAARNCLVSENGMVKISDFGLSRDVYTCDYYKIGGSRLLPLRWMAPESILYGRFTLESDVWAFGVLLWEIFTWGKQPYYGHSNEEVVQLILDGVLLCPPIDCPPSIRQIMAGCWKTEPKDRLKFQQISKLLHKENGKPDGETMVERSQNKAQMVQNWTDSGYEVPKSILTAASTTDAVYMEVV